MHDIGIIAGRVYIDGRFMSANIYVKDGKISAVSGDVLSCHEFYDAENKYVTPGLIDPHVHFELNAGGRVSADDFHTGSVAAAYGGITTFIDFLDPVSKGSDMEAALVKRKKLAEKSVIDYMFHATAANPVGETENIAVKMKELGLTSLKIFTTYSESGRMTGDREIEKLLELSKKSGFMLLAHVENDDTVHISKDHLVREFPYARSEESETSKALLLADMVRRTGGELYMVHTSSGRTVRELIKGFSDILGKSFHIESCPHYFALDSNLYIRPDGCRYAMIPPLRDSQSARLLKKYSHFVETIGTDHCPYNLKEKQADRLIDIAMGIGSVEYSFPVIHSIIGDRAIDKMTRYPAELFGLYPWKGSLSVGSDADIMIYDDSRTYEIKDNHSACDYNVYEGMKVQARVESTISRGNFIVKRGVYKGGSGRCLL